MKHLSCGPSLQQLRAILGATVAVSTVVAVLRLNWRTVEHGFTLPHMVTGGCSQLRQSSSECTAAVAAEGITAGFNHLHSTVRKLLASKFY